MIIEEGSFFGVIFDLSIPIHKFAWDHCFQLLGIGIFFFLLVGVHKVLFSVVVLEELSGWLVCWVFFFFSVVLVLVQPWMWSFVLFLADAPSLLGVDFLSDTWLSRFHWILLWHVLFRRLLLGRLFKFFGIWFPIVFFVYSCFIPFCSFACALVSFHSSKKSFISCLKKERRIDLAYSLFFNVIITVNNFVLVILLCKHLIYGVVKFYI